MTPLSGRDISQYGLAAVLLAIGVGLWLVNRVYVGRTELDPAKLGKKAD